MISKERKIHTHIDSFINNNGDETRYQLVKIPYELIAMPVLTQESEDAFHTPLLQDKKEIIEKIGFLMKHRILPKEKKIAHVLLFYCPQEYEHTVGSLYASLCLPNTVIFDVQIMLRAVLEKYGRMLNYTHGGSPKGAHGDGKISRTSDTALDKLQSLIDELEAQGLVKKIDAGHADAHEWLFLPLSPRMVQLHNRSSNSNFVVNSHFFLMEILDCMSPFDKIGEAFGLLQYKDKVCMPPLYNRHTFFFSKDHRAYCKMQSLYDTTIRLTYPTTDAAIEKNQIFTLSHGVGNVIFYKRPEYSHCRAHKTLLVFSGADLIAIAKDIPLEIPNAGFIVGMDIDLPLSPKPHIDFMGDEDVLFAIQVGPLVQSKGKLVSDFTDDYYRQEGVEYPPTHYPLDWHRGMAARILLGACTETSELVVVWIEGCRMYELKHTSEGASLEDTRILSNKLGLSECINLDGGGSSHIIYRKDRILSLSDSQGTEDFERPVGMGLEFSLDHVTTTNSTQ